MLAGTYSALGRHQDALIMEENTLQLLRRVLPEDHPDIGATDTIVFVSLTCKIDALRSR